MRTECWGWELGFALVSAEYLCDDLLGVIQFLDDIRG